MGVTNPESIRNITFVGHVGAGKTSLIEAMLFKTGVTNRLGSVLDGTSMLDCSEEERDKHSSIESAVCSLSHGGMHVNIIDTPGLGVLCGQAIGSLAAAEVAVAVVSAASGVQVNTRKMVARARAAGLGVWIVLNHIDATNVDLPDRLKEIQEAFGAACLPLNLPAGGGTSVVDCLGQESGDVDFSSVGEAHTAIIEAVVGADDALMEKYLGGELSDDEVKAAVPTAVAQGEFVPILFTNAMADVGVSEFLDALITCCPSPVTGKQRILVDGEAKSEIKPDVDGDFIAQVFKISVELKSHIKYLSVRVLSGRLTSDLSIKSVNHPKAVRPGHVLRLSGGDHSEMKEAIAGDIAALAKLDFAIGDVIFAGNGGTVEMPVFPKPMFSLALESKSRGDEDKIAMALRRFAEEDPCFVSDRGTGGELVIHGMGEQQLRMALQKMSHHYKLEVETKPPKIPYRETITGSAKDIEYTHKKQSGGAGQFGRVIINLLPAERGEGYEFVDKIFGGSIDQSFRPSVDKGVRAQMALGVVAGYPVVDVKVELIDGKTHPVDSKDIAFQIAGRGAFKEAFAKSHPVILEPVVTVEVTVPTENVGDIQGDLASRRGRPQGQEILPGGLSLIKAVVPLAELADYNSRLSSISAGQGSFDMEFSHYDVVPGNIQQQLVAAHKNKGQEEST